MHPTFKKNAIILFQGDSITDCGRLQDQWHGWGNGYVKQIASTLSARFASLDLKFVNRGISGNRACDLETRWDDDALAIQPDILSILIGINDTWRRFDRNDPTSTESFAASYDAILQKTRKHLPDCRIIILEPFLLPVPEDRRAWRDDLDPKIAAIRDLARRHANGYIPLDGIFAAASVQREPAFWAGDGVHPSTFGHSLIADEWMRHLGVASPE
jgi:acyl-CoA thioesterase I